ncbi:GNAT family N-acetyltransferase [Rhizobium sp. G21]|nr:GNAT family N-acetyltransferase [Rhizobium sp. G21]
MAQLEEPSLVIEPLDPARHDRDGFSSGVMQVDNFLKKTANKLSQADNLRTYVMTEDGQTITGFYAINSHAIDYHDLPTRYARTRPGHGMIPAAFISMIGRDQRYYGKGYGGILLMDCLVRLTRVADQIGTAMVMLDVLDCGDLERTTRRMELYRSYGFMPLSAQPLRMYLPIATVRSMLGSG